MPGSVIVQYVLIAIAMLLVLLVALRTELTRAVRGKVLAFAALFLLPALAVSQGFSTHMETAKTTEFCLSCHIMEPYGRSLAIDDPSYVPAVHYQNHLVPADQACFTCHTTYTLFGDYQAKARGLRHLYVHYIGTEPRPEDITLYTPYSNRECLHCHLGMRTFEEAGAHTRAPAMLADMKSNKLSCTASDCHEFIHDVGHLGDSTFWKPGP